MRTSRILTSTFAALLLSTTVLAAADMPQSYGAGSHQCQEITQVLSGKGSMTPDVAKRALENFSAGFLSGATQQGGDPVEFAKGLAHYCADHPYSTVIQAAREILPRAPQTYQTQPPQYQNGPQDDQITEDLGPPPQVYVPGPGTLWLGPEYGLSPRDRMVHIPPPPPIIIQQPQVIYAPPPPPVIVEQPQVYIEAPPPPPMLIPAPLPVVPDGQGGWVPFTNSRVMPDGSLRPYNPAIDGAFYYQAY
jgi:hypothetical protein